MNLADVPQTALRVLKDLPFKFEDYKANQRLACWQYERGLLECYNHLGVIESKKNAQCVVSPSLTNSIRPSPTFWTVARTSIR